MQISLGLNRRVFELIRSHRLHGLEPIFDVFLLYLFILEDSGLHCPCQIKLLKCFDNKAKFRSRK